MANNCCLSPLWGENNVINERMLTHLITMWRQLSPVGENRTIAVALCHHVVEEREMTKDWTQHVACLFMAELEQTSQICEVCTAGQCYLTSDTGACRPRYLIMVDKYIIQEPCVHARVTVYPFMLGAMLRAQNGFLGGSISPTTEERQPADVQLDIPVMSEQSFYGMCCRISGWASFDVRGRQAMDPEIWSTPDFVGVPDTNRCVPYAGNSWPQLASSREFRQLVLVGTTSGKT